MTTARRRDASSPRLAGAIALAQNLIATDPDGAATLQQDPVHQRVAEGLPVVGTVVYVPLACLSVVHEPGVSRVLVHGVDIHLGGEVVLQVDLHQNGAVSTAGSAARAGSAGAAAI